MAHNDHNDGDDGSNETVKQESAHTVEIPEFGNPLASQNVVEYDDGELAVRFGEMPEVTHARKNWAIAFLSVALVTNVFVALLVTGVAYGVQRYRN